MRLRLELGSGEDKVKVKVKVKKAGFSKERASHLSLIKDYVTKEEQKREKKQGE